MEIDMVIKECDDRRLKNKYNSAIYVIQRALALYSTEELAFSFNGGKDSTVLLHLLRAGYHLHKDEKGLIYSDTKGFPIRTIYFETPSAFPEINAFTYHTASTHHLQMDIIRTDVKSGLDALVKTRQIRAILLGVRVGDPTAVGQEQFSPSSPGWPPFMRINPILDWSYRDVWAFLLTCKVPYCSLYDQGYTSIGSINDTLPNSLLCSSNAASGAETFRPAYMLSDGRLERAGRGKKVPSSHQCPATTNNGFTTVDIGRKGTFSAAIIVVGDEILSGIVEDRLGPSLCRKLHSIGWSVTQVAVVRNDIDCVAEEIERRKSASDMVFLCGGVGPLHSDVSLAGVVKAFGVRLAPHEEFQESLEHSGNKQSTSTGNEMALLPEHITELLHHEKLPVPLIKCENIIVLSAANMSELENQWDCLIEISRSTGLIQLLEPFIVKSVTTNTSNIEVAKPLSKLCLEFPDLLIGCHRKSRSGTLVISITGKDGSRIDSALEQLRKKFPPDTLLS
ncbi:hypothetical protein MLD38_035401 [Melastoma candidum]|uniref:Uncharacterized protein n=1 Tax=Melastoma candidum TaxID=119954 RepID=A0ACB9LGK8_9MYRT|nr:hypothetical protein MLD38_035401 [Melastoma candidum]